MLADGTGAVVYARAGAGVTGPQDLANRSAPLRFGRISATGLDLTTLVAFDLLGTDVEAIFGFEGADRSGWRCEIDIDYQTTSAYWPTVQPLVESGAAVPLFSLGQVDTAGNVIRDPNFPDIPTVVEAYRTLHGTDPSGPGLRGLPNAARGHLHVLEGDVGAAGHATAGHRAAAPLGPAHQRR